MRQIAAALVFLGLASCASTRGSWVWRRADGTYDEKKLNEDIAACEEYDAASAARGPNPVTSGGRQWGEWGSYPFEFCMNERNWVLKRAGESASAPTPTTPAPASSVPAVPAPAAPAPATSVPAVPAPAAPAPATSVPAVPAPTGPEPAAPAAPAPPEPTPAPPPPTASPG